MFVALPAPAQTNDEINAGLQFSFSPPGARSMALGYAFAGLADDATAAYANPAGLLWLRRPEASFEARTSNFKTRYPNLGSATGSPSFCGGPPIPEGCQDTVEGLRFAEFDSRVNGVSFLSYVHLFRRKRPTSEAANYYEKWRLAIYRHELANFQAHIDRAEGAFIREGDQRSRLTGIIGELDLNIENFGLAAAYALRENFWLGLGISYYAFSLDSVTRHFATTQAGGVSEAIGTPTDFGDHREYVRNFQSGSDGYTALTAGFLWKNKGPAVRWSVGTVYRQAPVFDFDYTAQYGFNAIKMANDLGRFNDTDPAHLAAISGRGRFQAPDFLSVGFMYSFVEDVFRMTFEYARVGYSSLSPEQNALIDGITASGLHCGNYNFGHQPLVPPIPCTMDLELLRRFTVDDVQELHLGFEYQIRTYPKVVLRAGAWSDPDHQMRFEVPGDGRSLSSPEDRFAPRFAPGEDEIHLTGGLGIVPLRGRRQIDLALDLSDRAEVASLSAVFRW